MTTTGEVEALMSGLEARLGHRFDAIDRRLDTVDHRFDVIGIQMETLEHRITASFRGELMKTVIASNLISILGVGSLVIASAKLL